MDITITIDDADVQWIKDGLVAKLNYQEQIDNPNFDPELPVDPVTNPEFIDNPVPVNQFLKSEIIKFIKVQATLGHNILASNTNVNLGDSLNIT